jgi:hypothetical protein
VALATRRTVAGQGRGKRQSGSDQEECSSDTSDYGHNECGVKDRLLNNESVEGTGEKRNLSEPGACLVLYIPSR